MIHTVFSAEFLKEWSDPEEHEAHSQTDSILPEAWLTALLFLNYEEEEEDFATELNTAMHEDTINENGDVEDVVVVVEEENILIVIKD
jgi:SepF-like predicted cell division protein (DUF552 family)